jgi:hypothetical protein
MWESSCPCSLFGRSLCGAWLLHLQVNGLSRIPSRSNRFSLRGAGTPGTRRRVGSPPCWGTAPGRSLRRGFPYNQFRLHDHLLAIRYFWIAYPADQAFRTHLTHFT